MNNKRLLLLGITIIGSAWAYPTPSNKMVLAKDGTLTSETGTHATDTDRVAGNKFTPATLTSPGNTFFKELFLATSIGASNGARLNPRALSFVQDYMKENWGDLQAISITGRPYFNLIDGILNEYGLPTELKYLAVIESNLKSSAVSRVGAVGPWQLMPQTARDLGLKVGRGNDERRNYTKSTRAAALYLRDLYRQLGDWLLVIAAYNTGTTNVYHAIHRSGSRNFWDLQNYLPLESRLHVKRFIGTQYVFEGQGSITTLTREEALEQMPSAAMQMIRRKLSGEEGKNAKTLSISGKYLSSVIARHILMDVSTFERYNPEFDKVMINSNNSYDLKLPADKMELFASNKYEILQESVQLLANGSISVPESTTEGIVSK